MALMLALDEGTTSCRAIVFNQDAAVKGLAQSPIEQYFPQPGWVEHDAVEIRDKQIAVAQQAMAQAGVGERDIAGIGITNQRETVVIWDRSTGEPIHNAIVWQDRRTADHMATLEADTALSADLRARTGLRADPYFSASKAQWLLNHVDGARGAAENGRLAMGTIECWLLWCLTGGRVHATDASNASRTLLYNIHDRCWDPELLRCFQIPEAVLPQVVPCWGDIGEANVEGLKGIGIRGMIGDQQSALLGQGAVARGQAKTTYGTGCFLLLNTGDEAVTSNNGLLTTIGWMSPDGAATYALEGSVFMGGATVQWLRDGLGIIETAKEVGTLAESVPDTGGVVLVPAFVGLGSPHWNADARGALLGMTRGTTHAHIARAALEGIACSVHDLLRAMEEDAGVMLSTLQVDGGASASNLLMQMQADLLNVPVVRPTMLETTAFGAAAAAGMGAGVFDGPSCIAEHGTIDRRFEPDHDVEHASSVLARWQRAVHRSRSLEED